VGVERRTYRRDKKQIQISVETQNGIGYLEDLVLHERMMLNWTLYRMSSVVWITIIRSKTGIGDEQSAFMDCKRGELME
jgi:hypothetical protein